MFVSALAFASCGCNLDNVITGTSSSSGTLSVPVVGKEHNASVAWCFTLPGGHLQI